MSSTESSRYIITTAKKWLAECISTHASCQRRARLSTIWSSDNTHIIRDLGVGDMMPRRLLRLNDGSLTDNTRFCIQEFDKTDNEFPYVALSYCWGHTDAIPRTTTENIKDRKAEGILVTDLPSTFRDAIEIAAGLGYPYLWIDALCIIQDDAEDWKLEAPRMAVVYGNAICTIHATDVGDVQAGFLGPKTAGSERGTLDKRAWAMQERAITPRSLIFTADGLRWECREGRANADSHAQDNDSALQPAFDSNSPTNSPRSLKEVFTFFRDWRIPGTKGPDREPYTEPRIDVNYGVQGDKLEYYSFIQTWWKLISLYTPRLLTHESDRFLAMNGVAAVAQQRAEMRSTWGLWLDFLETELLWYVDPVGPEGAATNRWLAPSWSWAAIKNGRVRNAFYEHVKSKDFYVKLNLMIKPEIHIPYGTSFDQPLPIPAWKTFDSHSIQLWGDMRVGQIEAYLDESQEKRYKATFDPVGRWSEEETFDFRPDVSSQFPVGESVHVICFLMWHMGAENCNLPENINLLLVLRQRTEQPIEVYDRDVPNQDILEQRTMLRVGYLECRFKTMRDYKDIWDDMWNKKIWLI